MKHFFIIHCTLYSAFPALAPPGLCRKIEKPTTGLEPVNLILTKDVLYQLSYMGETPGLSNSSRNRLSASLFELRRDTHRRKMCTSPLPGRPMLPPSAAGNHGLSYSGTAGNEIRTHNSHLGRVELYH